MNKVTQEEFDAFKLRVIDAVIREYKDHETKKEFEIMPRIYLKPFNKKYKIANIPPPLFNDDNGKDLAAVTIRDMIRYSESPLVCFVTEAYQARIKKEDYNSEHMVRPSQLPEDQREEVIFLNFEAKDLDSYLISFIKKFKDGITKIVPLPSMTENNENVSESKGRFTNFYTDLV